MAGVAVGVCALTSIISVEQAWRAAVARFFAKMDLMTVMVDIPETREWGKANLGRPVTEKDAQAIAQACPAVSSALLVCYADMRVEQADYAASTPVIAVEPGFQKTLPDEVREGRIFTPEEAAARAPVCVLSLEARVLLFGTEQAVGRDVRIAGHRLQVVGVILGKNHYRMPAAGVYVPSTWTRALLRSGQWTWPQAFALARAEDPKAASDQINRLVRRWIGAGEPGDYTSSLWEAREAALHARDRATFYSGLAALCALLAAGIGIAALLFLSVSERSAEIGITRSLGASRGRVYVEQVIAATLLSGAGGVIGAAGSVPASAAGVFASRWQPLTTGADVSGLPKMSELALSVSWQPLLIALALAVMTGVVAALAPAAEAAGVNPAAAIAARPGTRRGLREVLTCLQVGFGVLVLVVLTSYFSVLHSEERAEVRSRMGQDRAVASADPIAALHKPVSERDGEAYREALAEVLASPERMADLRAQTPLLERTMPTIPLIFDLSGAGQVAEAAEVKFTTVEFLASKHNLTAGNQEQAAARFRAQDEVVVIDPRLRELLFADRDPVGRTVNIAGKKFTVVGVRRNDGRFYDGVAWAPIRYYQALKDRSQRDFSAMLSREDVRVEGPPRDVRQYTAALLQLRAALLPMLPEPYRKGIEFNGEMPMSLREWLAQDTAAVARGASGALAILLVALIGLANMLLVSVRDELRETGVRRALGATRPDIFLHFLSRGVLLSAFGAALGLALGAAVCWATRTWSEMPVFVSAFWAVAGALAAVLAGLITSAVPAVLAARIRPVEALRYE
jgi:putative ABC transport system permease protein